MAMSGSVSRASASARAAVGGLGDDLKIGPGLEQGANAAADDVVIVRDQYALYRSRHIAPFFSATSFSVGLATLTLHSLPVDAVFTVLRVNIILNGR